MNPTSLLPTVTTTPVSITPGGVFTGGNITDNGGPAVISRGVCYASSPNPTVEDSLKIIDPHTGFKTFLCTLERLTNENTYFIRAFATTLSGTVYGKEISYTHKTSSETEAHKTSLGSKETRYPALITIAKIYMLFAWIFGILTIITAIVILGIFIDESAGYALLLFVSVLIGGALVVLLLVAGSESLRVFVDIEYNTRKASEK